MRIKQLQKLGVLTLCSLMMFGTPAANYTKTY